MDNLPEVPQPVYSLSVNANFKVEGMENARHLHIALMDVLSKFRVYMHPASVEFIPSKLSISVVDREDIF